MATEPLKCVCPDTYFTPCDPLNEAEGFHVSPVSPAKSTNVNKVDQSASVYVFPRVIRVKSSLMFFRNGFITKYSGVFVSREVGRRSYFLFPSLALLLPAPLLTFRLTRSCWVISPCSCRRRRHRTGSRCPSWAAVRPASRPK